MIQFSAHFRVSYNHARPVIFEHDNVMQLARGFLKHPLTTLDDSRFVVSVEYLACRRESSGNVSDDRNSVSSI